MISSAFETAEETITFIAKPEHMTDQLYLIVILILLCELKLL